MNSADFQYLNFFSVSGCSFLKATCSFYCPFSVLQNRHNSREFKCHFYCHFTMLYYVSAILKFPCLPFFSLIWIILLRIKAMKIICERKGRLGSTFLEVLSPGTAFFHSGGFFSCAVKASLRDTHTVSKGMQNVLEDETAWKLKNARICSGAQYFYNSLFVNWLMFYFCLLSIIRYSSGTLVICKCTSTVLSAWENGLSQN